LYFAYGSNLDWEQMKQRCSSVSFVCKAKLPKFKIAFTKWSKDRECWVADIIEDELSAVWGVVYNVNELDIGRLDKSEGYNPNKPGDGYRRVEIRVYEDGDEGNEEKKYIGKPLTVFTYVVFKKELKKRTVEKYKQQIIIGAKYWHLPPEYIEMLKKIEV